MAVPGRFGRNYRQILRQLDEDLLDVVAVLAAYEIIDEGRRRRRRYWVKPWLERRSMLGQYDTLFQELDRESAGDYFGFIRMDRNLFGEILLCVAPRITKGPR